MPTARIGSNKRPEYILANAGEAWYVAQFLHSFDGFPLYRLLHGPFLFPQDAVIRIKSLSEIDDLIGGPDDLA